MKFVVLADEEIFKAFISLAPDEEWIRADKVEDFLIQKDTTAFFNMKDDSFEGNYSGLKVPVFINSVITHLSEIISEQNIIRINAWPGFLEKELWEIAGNISPAAETVLRLIGKKFIAVQDDPGFVTARIIAMIINEAYFAKGEAVSTEDEIDTAMKLGTNYPYGPFEWGRLIGLKNIYALLKKLSSEDPRYAPAPALEREYVAL